MRKLNKKGFTLIELLAVIVIMGILMMVAIPAMTRYIENSRKDTMLSTGKEYVNAVKKMWASDSISCDGIVSTANPVGTYYVEIDSLNDANSLLESGGKSPWGNREVTGYVRIVISADSKGRDVTKYYLGLHDGKDHGIEDGDIEADDLVRGNVKTRGIDRAKVIVPDDISVSQKCAEN